MAVRVSARILSEKGRVLDGVGGGTCSVAVSGTDIETARVGEVDRLTM